MVSTRGTEVSQLIALDHAERVTSLTLACSTPGGPGHAAADLPPMAPELAAQFTEESPQPDWSDWAVVIGYHLAGERSYAGSHPFDEAYRRDLAARTFDRTTDIASSTTNHFLIDPGDPWRGRLSTVGVPTLVLHGRRPVPALRPRRRARGGDPRGPAGRQTRHRPPDLTAYLGRGGPRDRHPGGKVMTVGTSLGGACGDWTGVNRLRMLPDDDYVESVATARVGLVAGGVAAVVRYTWMASGTAHDGVLLLCDGAESGSAAAIWLDSWHQRPQWTTLAGTVDDYGVITIAGAYDGGGWRPPGEQARRRRTA